MRFHRTRRLAQPNASRTFLTLERLDARVMPSTGVMRPDVGGARPIDSMVAKALSTGEDAPAGFAGDSPAMQVIGLGHVHPFSSKPGGTGEG